jgi:hypothetical protein
VRFHFLVAAAALLAASPALADDQPSRTIDRQTELGAAHAVALTGSAGDVHFEASSDATIRVHARLHASSASDLSRMDISVRTDGDVVRIASVFPRHSIFNWSGSNDSIDYDVAIPRGVRVTVSLAAGDVVVDGLEGPISAHDSFGDIQIHGVSQDVTAGTRTGDIEVSLAPGWRGHELELWTTVGDVTLISPPGLRARVQAHTRIGDVRGATTLGGSAADPWISLASTIGDIEVQTK